MSDEKSTPGPVPPPTITPRQAVPRPPVPGPPEPISTEHFALPDVDVEALSKAPEFSAITDVEPGEVAASDAVRHGPRRTEAARSPEPAGRTQDAAASPEEPASPPTAFTPRFSPTIPGPTAGAAAGGAAFATASPASAAAAATAVDDERPEPVKKKPAPVPGGPRKVRLSVARVDPWSVMKLSFLLSVAVGIMIVVATWVFWYALNDLAVFTKIDDLIRSIAGDESSFDILQYVERDRVLSLATMLAVVDVVLLTALATIGAFLYNVVASLVGGVHLTLTDD